MARGGEKRVYFLKPIGMDGPIKIGCSVAPDTRLKTLDIWSPLPLELLASCPGDHGHERALHFRFRDDLCHGEWFTATPELHAVIEHVRNTGGLPALPRAPYGSAKVRGKNPNRDKGASLEKARLTRRIGRAEKHAHGWFYRNHRPDWVKEAIQGWQGPFTPLPSADMVRRLEAYIGELLRRPKDTRGWREIWAAERKSREEAEAA